ncbi:RNA polymerase sigma factor [Larkinella terrae]|uniref:Sigma-70 family RNA polymerase sigma factor n=1 Tax=Larkinella terrae TaxID=2025311 RepID=A0A7K0EJG9_9BACT|nr:RNA polymerase sigma factor [Larkinella terrae]MRS61967.1 sigma-70 family RNA polymerase sigma factor [Larkinella terrae]
MNDVTKHFWEATYKQHIAKMIGVCYRYTYNRQTAEDLAHDAFLVAIDKSSSFENKGSFEGWFRRIVVNVALQHLRQQKKQKAHEDRIIYETPVIDFQNEHQTSDENGFSEAELLDAVGRLPEHHKLVFNLYVFDQYTHAQIGAELGISEGTSKSHLARARKKIREILTKKANEDKKRKRFLFLLLLPDRLWKIDHLLTGKLKHFELQPQNVSPINTTGFGTVSMPAFKTAPGFSASFLPANVATLAMVMNLAVVVWLQVKSETGMNESIKVEKPLAEMSSVSGLNSEKEADKKFLNLDTYTATFSNTGILSSEKTLNSKNMKSLNTVSALLLTTSALSLDSTSLLTHPLQPIQVENQEIVKTAALETARTIEAMKPMANENSEEMYGTFYASELFWSAENNYVYLRGNKVKVNLNTQKFTGSGKFSLFGKISYLIVDGTPRELNETIKLADKKYRLVKLMEKEAVEKYGEKGKIGAVEITLAE